MTVKIILTHNQKLRIATQNFIRYRYKTIDNTKQVTFTRSHDLPVYL